MQPNVGGIDRVLRVVVGAAIIGWGVFAQSKPQRIKRLRIALRRQQSLPHPSARLRKQALHSGESVPDYPRMHFSCSCIRSASWRACASYAALSCQVSRGCRRSFGTSGTESGTSSPKMGSV